MGFKIDVVSEMQLKSNKALSLYDVNTSRHLNRVANMFRNHITKAMKKSGGGRSYKVSKTGQPHTASVRGNPPAIDTGNLSNSFFVMPSSPARLQSSLKTNVHYAKYLEDRTGLNRPFMSKRSKPFQSTVKYANDIAKQISLKVRKIWVFILLIYKQYYIQH